jgi:hypothetical protein
MLSIIWRQISLLVGYGKANAAQSISFLPGWCYRIESTQKICISGDTGMSLIIIIAFFAMRSLLKTGGICFSIALSVPGYGIICRFHGYLGVIWPLSWLPRNLSWALASLKLLY